MTEYWLKEELILLLLRWECCRRPTRHTEEAFRTRLPPCRRFLQPLLGGVFRILSTLNLRLNLMLHTGLDTPSKGACEHLPGPAPRHVKHPTTDKCVQHEGVLSLANSGKWDLGDFRGGEGRRVRNTHVFLRWWHGKNQLIILIHGKSCNQKLLFTSLK